VDWNSDGKIDLICGERDGYVNLFINVGTASHPVLTDRGRVRANGTAIDVGYYSMPRAADWNRDGLLDLIVGESSGKVRVYINDGTPAVPHFTGFQYVQDNGVDLSVSSRSAPCFHDLDQDGLRDLVLGEYGGKIRFYKNYGTASAPSFSGSTICKTSGQEADVFSQSRPDVVDWDNDGAPDLVVGSLFSVPVLFRNNPSALLFPDMTLNYTGPFYIPPGGDTITFDVTVENPHAQPITFDFFTTLQVGKGGFWGPILNYQSVTLSPGQIGGGSFAHFIPGTVPKGQYYYFAYVGSSTDWQFAERGYFYFAKK